MAVTASALAMPARAYASAASASVPPCCVRTSATMAIECPGPENVPAPSAQYRAMVSCSGVDLRDVVIQLRFAVKR